VGEIAGQFHASAALPGAEAGVPYALAAASERRAAHALAGVVRFLEYALDLIPAADVAATAEVACQLAIAQAEASMLDAAPRGLDRALAALAAANSPAEAMADVVYRVTAPLQDAMADQDRLDPLIARGLAALGDTRGLIWARLKLLERPRQRIASRPVDVQRWLGFDREAVQIAGADGTDLDRARSLEHLDRWGVPELMSAAQEIVLWDDSAARLRGLDVVIQVATCLKGGLPETVSLVEAYAREADETGSLPARALARVYQSTVCGVSGDFAGAEALYRQAEALAERIPFAGRLVAATRLVGELACHHVAPDWGTLAETMLREASRPEQVLWFRPALAAFAAYSLVEGGRLAEGEALLRDVVPAIVAAEAWDYGGNCAVCLAGDAAASLGDAALAAALLPASIAIVDEQVGSYFMTSAELTAARLLATLGRSTEALDYLAAARADLDRRGQRPLRAIVDLEESTLRRSLDGGDQADMADAAARAFRSFGMHRWSERVAACQASPERAQQAPDGLSPREVEILRRVAAGERNADIAAALFLSVHTIERHVHNAYGKIGARNRAEATAYAIRHEL
jgi:DNA-binding CsgD family transcriptional regulator